METRPILKLQLSTTDKILKIVGWISLVGIWIMTIVYYSNLPDTIATHYNALGQVDGYGGKLTIFILPTIATILYVGINILNGYPHVFNYPIKITQENAYKQYTNATRLMRYLQLIIVIIFGFIAWKTIDSSSVEGNGLGMWFLPASIGLVIIPLVYFTIRSSKSK